MAICVYPLLRRGKAHCVYISSGWAASAGLIPDESTLLFFLSLGCFMLREERDDLLLFFYYRAFLSKWRLFHSMLSLSPFWARIFWICVFILPSGGNNPPGVPPPCHTHSLCSLSSTSVERFTSSSSPTNVAAGVRNADTGIKCSVVLVQLMMMAICSFHYWIRLDCWHMEKVTLLNVLN